VSVHLLDVNLLLAILWPAQEAHDRATTWFRNNQKTGWATCPFTQTAVVRILSNPAFSPHALSPAGAEELLANNLTRPAHRFWPADIDYATAISPFSKSIFGHKQVSDAYLLGLAIHRRGKFATLDPRIRTLLPDGSRLRDVVVEV
jgi:uncharacterized protein